MSTFLQVLVSIQSMIFHVEPLKNIPFYGQAVTERYDASLHYVSWLTVRWGILDRLRNLEHQSEGLWTEAFEQHCRANAGKMVDRLMAWATDHPGVPTAVHHFHASWHGSRTGQATSNVRMEDLCRQVVELLKGKGYLQGPVLDPRGT